MRAWTFLVLASLTLAVARPVTAQTPELELALQRARDHTPLLLSLEQEQADWLEGYADLTAAPDRAEDVRHRIEALLAQAERDARLGGTSFSEPPVMGRDCLVTGLKGCQSRIGGYLAVESASLRWQVQDGYTDEAGVSGGIVFLADVGADRSGPTAPIAWGFDAARFDPPVLLAGPEFDGKIYIAVPGVRAGSGSGNADLLFRWDLTGRRLTQIDANRWRDALPSRLPPGRSVLQGIRYDWENMMAVTPLWREGDPHCCGTGGTAILSFTIEDGGLVLSDVQVR